MKTTRMTVLGIWGVGTLALVAVVGAATRTAYVPTTPQATQALAFDPYNPTATVVVTAPRVTAAASSSVAPTGSGLTTVSYVRPPYIPPARSPYLPDGPGPVLP